MRKYIDIIAEAESNFESLKAKLLKNFELKSQELSLGSRRGLPVYFDNYVGEGGWSTDDVRAARALQDDGLIHIESYTDVNGQDRMKLQYIPQPKQRDIENGDIHRMT